MPVKKNIPPSPFLPGTALKEGARGITVKLLHDKLCAMHKSGSVKSRPSLLERITQSFGGGTRDAVTELGCSNGEVTADFWQTLGLPVGSTWQDMFAPVSLIKNNPTVTVEILANTAVIKYYPRFLLTQNKNTRPKPSSLRIAGEYQAHIKQCLDGVLRWDSGIHPNPNPVVIQGVAGSVNVQIYDAQNRLYNPCDSLDAYHFDADSRSCANVILNTGGTRSSIVWDAFFWRAGKKLCVRMNADEHCLSRTMEHEFGHVLGLFDAYGYAKRRDPDDGSLHYGGHPWPDWPLPPARIDGERIRRNSVMICNYGARHSPECRNLFVRTSLDYEMLLFAWRDNKLQLFADSILGKRSNAFFH